ncbi:MAG: acetate--CoA ligase family protein, partial [Pseudomonadota bacterium]
RDQNAMAACWGALTGPNVTLTLIILDYPRSDRGDPSDWDIATNAVIAAAQSTRARFAVVATLPELLPEKTAMHLAAHGVVPLHGLDQALTAIDVMSDPVMAECKPIVLPGPDRAATTLTEADAKNQLAQYDVPVPKNVIAKGPVTTVPLAFPVVAKVLGLAHKTGAGGLALNLKSVQDVQSAQAHLAPGDLLIEEMVTDGIAELLVGIIRDPAHGFVLTLGAGGTLTEILADTQSLLIPADADAIRTALDALKIAPILAGYRGKPGVDMDAVIKAVTNIQSYVFANSDTLEEVEVNPLICTPHGAVAVDALIRTAPQQKETAHD